MLKTLKNIALATVLLGGFNACDTDSFLKEDVLDFYTPENSYQTVQDFQYGINYLHNRVRGIYMGPADYNLDAIFSLRYGTDFAVNATDYSPAAKLNDYLGTMVPAFFVPENIWSYQYQIISNANVLINRTSTATGLTEENKNLFRAQGLFFRAWAYNFLANLYGGVPLVLEESSVPRRDLTRASREAVYQQCRIDLEEAITYLGNVESVAAGAVNKQAAQHVLTEVLISLGDYTAAIEAATAVISHPGLALMTERFGSHAARDGDVIRDLYELNNQNRSSGNTEGILVLQADFQNPASVSRDSRLWSIMPSLQSLQVLATDANGTAARRSAIRQYTDQLGGRGVGWMRPTAHFLYGIWSDRNDLRNSSYNILRDVRMDHPGLQGTDAYGKWYVADGFKAKATAFGDTIRSFFPLLRKVSLGAGDFPAAAYEVVNGSRVAAPFGGNYLVNASGDIHQKDEYLIRLAETYLLRAEAHIRNNNPALAAADINVVRRRAHAADVSAAAVNLDLLLDERLRELYMEEFRMVTLCRMGLLYARDVKYNEKAGLSIQSYHNLWPIPFSEIERNTQATIEQNPGYN